jgi:CRISPR-associated protein Csb1
LLHGVYLESIGGVLRIPRALSGFIEAEGVQRVVSGGVKNDRVQASKDEASGQTANEGFGNVPFHRTEFVASRITAYFNLDVAQIRSYRLGTEMEALLVALAMFKIRRFLSVGLRLRTACDFEADSMETRGAAAADLPDLPRLEAMLPALIQAAAPAFATLPTTLVTYTGEARPKSAKKPGK